MRGWLKFLACFQLFLGFISIPSLLFFDQLANLMGLHEGRGVVPLILLVGVFIFYTIVSVLTAIVALVYIRKQKQTGGGGGTGLV